MKVGLDLVAVDEKRGAEHVGIRKDHAALGDVILHGLGVHGKALDEGGGNRVKEPVEALEKRDGNNLHHT